jgi:hypothetical protein
MNKQRKEIGKQIIVLYLVLVALGLLIIVIHKERYGINW